MDRGAGRATVHRVAQNQTWLSKWAHTPGNFLGFSWTWSWSCHLSLDLEKFVYHSLFLFCSLYVCPRAFSNFVSSALKGVLIVVYSGASCTKTGEGCHLGRSGSETSIFLSDLSEFTIHSNIHLFTTYLLSTYWVLGSMLEVSFLFELCWGAACGIFVPRPGI